MLMVIYSHLFYCNNELMIFFSPIFLTTFFFISGYLQNTKWTFTNFLENRTRTILIPFFIYGIILIILRQFLTFNSEIPIKQDFVDFIKQVRGENDQLWFLPAIWTFGIVFYWILKISKKDSHLLVLSTILFILNSTYIYWLDGKMLYWHITLIGTGCFYMSLGKLYKKYEAIFDKLITKKIHAILILTYIVFIATIRNYYSFFGSKYILDSIIITIIGIIILIYLCKYYNFNNKLILYIGSNSLLYFIIHGKIISLLQTIIKSLYKQTNTISDLILACAITFTTAIIAIIPIYLINKYLPQTIGKDFALWKASNKKNNIS